MLWSTIIKWGWTWYWKLCRTRWITAYEICVILHIYHSAKAEFNNCIIIYSKYFQALNKPSVLIDFFKTFAWFSAQLENMNSYYFSKRRWHSLSNSFYVSCLLIFFCSVLVIYSAISSFDSCRPAVLTNAKNSFGDAPLPWNEVAIFYRIDRSQPETKSVNWLH